MKSSVQSRRLPFLSACHRRARSAFLRPIAMRFKCPFIMGVGGSFDILAGAVQRAPARTQHLGLEWLYRVSLVSQDGM